MLVGQQIKFVSEVLDASKRKGDLGDVDSEQMDSEQILQERAKVYMQITVSVAVLIGGILGLFITNEPSVHKYFSALLGTVVGYWLR